MKFFLKSDALLSEQEIRRWLIELRGNPYTPASNYNVTAVFRVKYNGDDTYYFAGVNVENPHHRLTIHAEESCIAAMATAFGKHAEIVEGWILGAPKSLKTGDQDPLADNFTTPCGKCRQQIAGFSNPGVEIHGLTLNGRHIQTHQVGQLLPNAFSFKNFMSCVITKSSLPAGSAFSTIQPIENRLIRQGGSHPLSSKEIHTWLQQLESVDYATKTSQVVVLRLADNCYVAGVTIEDAAFLSIDPIQCATAIAHVAFGSVCVEEVWVLSKNNHDQSNSTNDNAHPLSVFNTEAMRLFPQFMGFRKASKERSSQEESFVPLSLSAIQVLAQFARSDQIHIHTFNAIGTQIVSTLQESTQLIPVFARGNAQQQKARL